MDTRLQEGSLAMNAEQKIADLGEKEIIRSWLRPFLNPSGGCGLPGDDCAVLPCPAGTELCVSTDRVPADLISFKLGLIDHYELGYYLAVLNLSDIAAMGATPAALLLNLALPPDFLLEHLKQVVFGAHEACTEYSCSIVGGDLSSSSEMSLSATSLGFGKAENLLHRTGCVPGDLVYCTKPVGITPSAFGYFLRSKSSGLLLGSTDEDQLCQHFRKPRPAFAAAESLSNIARTLSDGAVTAMDNTDGVGQTLAELAELNDVGIDIVPDTLPIAPIARTVADSLGEDAIQFALGPGADFQLIGTIPREHGAEQDKTFWIIGEVVAGSGLRLRNPDGSLERFSAAGWNYFGESE